MYAPANTKRSRPFVVAATLLWSLTLGSLEARLSWEPIVGVGEAVPTILNERVSKRATDEPTATRRR
ncbi:MAG: hypothetical protein ABEI27_14555 [Halobellus sp.]|uniref:hypothetical protein n=1 Tax=Halobellus sp. TaxID=1979212 RepID=UPI0035D42EE0